MILTPETAANRRAIDQGGAGAGPQQAPFPWFGGKSRVADLVWSRFGDVPNYCEPFFGSGAVLLGRRGTPKIETINDLDGFVANFWRAVKTDPEAVAVAADNPVNEADLHARHMWLLKQRADITSHLMGDPDYYDAKMAGWWVWGLCCWIGSGWCSGTGPWIEEDGRMVLGDAGQGINRQLPHLGNAGHGINRKLPHLGDAGQGILDWMQRLADRLRRVRVCCGDWERICGPSVTTKRGITGVFLDPPYSDDADRADGLYASDSLTVAHSVRDWCLAHQDDPQMRIALCGYEGERELPGWECVAWQAHGGFGSQGEQAGRANKHRERIWFSPACLRGGRLL